MSSYGHSLRERVGALLGSLSLRLFLWLAVMLMLAFATYSYVNVRTTSRQWEGTVVESAERFSRLILSSTHYSMLLNRKEDVRQVIEATVREAGVDAVRIYDKQGIVVFSGESSEVGQRVDLEAEACVICHDRGEPLQRVPTRERTRIFRDPGNGKHRVLGLINPIENASECSSAACHAHAPDQTILGVLDVKMSLAAADARLGATRRRTIAAALVTILLVGVSSAMFIYRMVRRPVRRLIEGSRSVAQGDLNSKIEIDAGGEMGELADAFNSMTTDLHEAREEILGWSRHLEHRVHEKTGKLEDALAEIRDLEERKSHYMRISAHQLRSPLATIKTSLEVLTGGYVRPRTERGERMLRGAVQRVDDLLAIVNDLLELAKIREGQANAIWTPELNLTAMLRAVLDAAQRHAQQRDVRLTCSLTENVVLSWGVRGELRFALENIVDNAIKYSHAGGEVRVNLSVSGERAVLTVADRGIGIPADLQSDVFLEFVRAPNAKRHASQGTGLGLAIVKEAMQRHGGRVTLQSEPRGGTTLTAELLVNHVPPPDARRADIARDDQ